MIDVRQTISGKWWAVICTPKQFVPCCADYHDTEAAAKRCAKLKEDVK